VPRTRVILYREDDGSCPFLEWSSELPAKVRDKCHVGWSDCGRSVHYRILYFFHGAVAAVVSHALVKERAVPPSEIDRAVERRWRFEANPQKHIYKEV